MADDTTTELEETREQKEARERTEARAATKRNELHFHAHGRTASDIEVASYSRAKRYFGDIPFHLEIEVHYRPNEATYPYDITDVEPTASVRAFVPWNLHGDVD
jgi:hypothetical protein